MSLAIRVPEFSVPADVPRFWVRGDPVATALGNGVDLLFPLGERFFVRSVRRYLDRIDDPGLRERVRLFCGQEAQHARLHERWFATLEGQGYPVSAFLAWYERMAYGWLESATPPELRLAVTVALEHYTAVLAGNVFRLDLFDDVPAELRRLHLWHAAEEIEHADVAWDVLQRVDPRYRVRIAGLILATLGLAGFWAAAAGVLLWTDRVGPVELIRGMRRVQRRHPIGRTVFWQGIRSYLARDFRPGSEQDQRVASAWLAMEGL
jgi:predicted metal-dependent hydrolase